MYDDGYTEIMNVDVSQNAVEQMLERSKETRPNLKYKTADITDMTECFEDKSYDVILDKGTLDTMLCYEKPTVIGAKVLKEV
jgi:EEF1A lysine methyltransferase 4